MNVEKEVWVEETARRLADIQTGFAEETAEVRMSNLGDMLESMLQQVSAQDRDAFLAALANRFPEQEVQEVPRAERAEQDDQVVTSAIEDFGSPVALATRLAAVAQQLSSTDREAVTSVLSQTGLIAREKDTSPEVSAPGRDDVANKMNRVFRELVMNPLHLSHLDITRMAKLLVFLHQNFTEVSGVVLELWRDVAPKGRTHRKASDLEQMMKKYLERSTEVSSHGIEAEIDAVGRIAAAFVGGMGRAAGALSSNFLDQFMPFAIRQQVEKDGGNVFQTVEHRCWKKYEELSINLEAGSVEDALKKALRAGMEELLSSKK